MSCRNVDVWLGSMAISWIITSSVGGQTQIKPASYELNNDVMFYFKMDFNALLLWKEFYTQVQCVNKCTVSCFLLHLLLRPFSLVQIPQSWSSNLTLEVSRVVLVGIWWCSAVPLVESRVLNGHQKQDARNLVPSDVLKTIKVNSRGMMLTAAHGLICCVPDCILLLVHFSV